jgi:hypothetical protein
MIGEVKYINYDTDIFSEGQLFERVMHKRKPFEYERELRAIFWERDSTPAAQFYKPRITSSGLEIEVDLAALIEQVYVSPAAASWLPDLVKVMTAKCGYSFPVSPSALAATPDY